MRNPVIPEAAVAIIISAIKEANEMTQADFVLCNDKGCQVIPEAAVEAAAAASFQFMEDRPWAAVDPDEVSFFIDAARKALEAAKSHMLADLRAELVKLAQEFDAAAGGTLAYTTTDGRTQMRKNAHDQLIYVVENSLLSE